MLRAYEDEPCQDVEPVYVCSLESSAVSSESIAHQKYIYVLDLVLGSFKYEVRLYMEKVIFSHHLNKQLSVVFCFI